MTITSTANEATLKFYTLAEVAQNDGKEGRPVWIIYKNAVYDVTEYVCGDNHPGDTNVILDFAGRDCTRDFTEVGHSKDAMREMKTMKIGEIVEVESEPKKVASAQSIQSMVSSADSEKKRRRRFLLCR